VRWTRTRTRGCVLPGQWQHECPVCAISVYVKTMRSHPAPTSIFPSDNPKREGEKQNRGKGVSMRIGAGIAGILLGMFALLYVGVFGGMVGSATGWLGSLGSRNSTITNWASVVSLLSWLAPLLAIIGGVVTFSNPRAGGVMLAASACLLWYLLGLGMIGKLFVFPIGAAAVLAFSATRSAASV
jgi:hypothetical protein